MTIPTTSKMEASGVGLADSPGTGLSGLVGGNWAWGSQVLTFAIVVLVFILPVQLLSLPLNLSVFELWSSLTILMAGVFVAVTRPRIWLPYAVPMSLIAFASLVSVLMSSDMVTSFLPLVKEFYLYAWFVAMTFSLSMIRAKERRVVLEVWTLVVVAHAVLLVFQLVSGSFFELTADLFGLVGETDQWRPSGLFKNANSAGFFQLMGLTPLLLRSTTAARRAASLVIVVAAIVATGSMGAMSSLVVGFLMSLFVGIALAARAGRGRTVLTTLVGSTMTLTVVVVVGVAGGLLSGETITNLFVGRAERSADGRFALWSEALAIYADGPWVVGIGPDGFTVIGERQTFVHNDLLAFLVERGLLGAIGLLMLFALALWKGLRVVSLSARNGKSVDNRLLVFFGLTVAMGFYSLTHQIFHDRSMWLMLAFLEAILFHELRQSGERQLDAPGELNPVIIASERKG